MKRILKYILAILPILAAVSCSKTIDKDVPSNEVSLLELKIAGQMGTAVIERDGDEAKATVFIMANAGYQYSKVAVEGIVASRYATVSVTKGGTLNFSNPERKAKITVTAESGKTLDWWIYIKEYDAFYVGRWKVQAVYLHCNQNISGTGTGEWDTSISGAEFGDYGKGEGDNIVTITMNEDVNGNSLSGKLVHKAGADEEFGNFYGVFPPYSDEQPLDMNPRLRHLLPPGESEWELDLTTEKMKITQGNITSEMTFMQEGINVHFNFALPSAANEPGRDGFYDNMWKSSTDLRYVMYKLE